jgi:hypothetical protein
MNAAAGLALVDPDRRRPLRRQLDAPLEHPPGARLPMHRLHVDQTVTAAASDPVRRPPPIRRHVQSELAVLLDPRVLVGER